MDLTKITDFGRLIAMPRPKLDAFIKTAPTPEIGAQLNLLRALVKEYKSNKDFSNERVLHGQILVTVARISDLNDSYERAQSLTRGRSTTVKRGPLFSRHR